MLTPEERGWLGRFTTASGLSTRARALYDYAPQLPEELRLSGPPNHRRVGLIADTTEIALVDRVRTVLHAHGAPMSSAELRLRRELAGEKQSEGVCIPGGGGEKF
mgnify:CR=1 FL=1